METREWRQRRAGLVHQAREILEQADQEKRGLTQEEENRYQALMGEVTSLGVEIDRREALEALEQELAQPVGEAHKPDPEGRRDEQQRATWERFLRSGPGALKEQELRALQADSDIYGGYLLAPVQFVQALIKAVDNAVYMRQWATLYRVANADGLGAASLDNDPADPTWTGEISSVSEDSTMSFGRRELHPHPLSKLIKVSRKLLRGVASAEELVIARLGYKFGTVMENAYLNGSGAGEPLGVFTASAFGISTGRDYSTGNTATEIRFDGLIGAKYTLKGQYWGRARWIFHRTVLMQVAKLKDGDGQYLWRESVRAGEPDRILNFPVFMSEYAPSTMTTGLYVGLLGDFSNYWIADAMSMEVQRLEELYAATSQVGFIGRMESDGMPVLEEAFVRVKLA